ncbi:MAG: 16S rRNA (uracil(1498)-N(3))-methyltransferase [Clostridia bacterium]|nr:16S rRNA (uracil(1498)-N(3))-methyltransferase [Clostridia bacterium]
MSKFFVSKNQITNKHAVIKGADVNHLIKVLRANIGDSITICDGEGTDYEATIASFNRDEVHVDLLRSAACLNEPKTKVTLYQGLPKQGKMEWIIEKCVEMGIDAIVPVQMERSVVQLSAEQAVKKLERWQKTAEAAAKQCSRGKIPEVHMPIRLYDITKDITPEFLLLLYEGECSQSIKQALTGNKAGSVGIFIGPEGGFAPEEVVHLEALGAQSVTLGPRILRTETAGLVALSVLLYEWGDLTC